VERGSKVGREGGVRGGEGRVGEGGVVVLLPYGELLFGGLRSAAKTKTYQDRTSREGVLTRRQFAGNLAESGQA